jgi:MoaA/NifB/PqqE/SkfB family radical SAM enzyme
VHCDIWKNREKEDSPTVEQWKKVLLDLRKWLGPVQVTFAGGEALLKPFTPEIVAYGTSIGLFIELLTHGYWEEQAKIEKVALNNPYRFTISLDGI